MSDLEITPAMLTINVGAQEITWSDNSDLLDVLRCAHFKLPTMPWTGCEGGVVLIGLSVDGSFDQVVTSQPAGQFERADMVEQLLSVRDIADDCARALDSVMSGVERRSATEVFREQADQIRDQQAAVERALVLLRKIADDDRCPVDVRDAAEDCSQRLGAALGKAATND